MSTPTNQDPSHDAQDQPDESIDRLEGQVAGEWLDPWGELAQRMAEAIRSGELNLGGTPAKSETTPTTIEEELIG